MIHDFKNKRVVVMGLGLHGGGVGVVKFLAQQGAKILVTDLKTKKELKESIEKLATAKVAKTGKIAKIQYILGKHRVGDFKNADLIIKNPGVPRNSEYLKIAKKNKIPIETDIGLFFELCPSKNIIGVTGTKGKSTAATLIYEILKTKYKTILAGNIRTSVLEELPKITKNTIVVLELSSWQLEDIKPHKISPHIAVITNIMQDHLNRYKGIGDYIKSKKIIFNFQKPDDILILNHDDKIVSKFAKESKGKVIYYFKKQALKYSKYIQIMGEHNLKHISAALAVAKLFKVPSDLIKKTLINFKGIAGRLEFIREISGIKYYNDTTATTPEATITALNSFPGKKIILIAGGTDKKLNFKELARIIHKKVKLLILLPGTATQKLTSRRLVARRAKNMKEAVKIASRIAERNDIVLLSPGCASFGLFKHEFDRGEQFQKCIKLLEEKI
jgi:UDP-N-acetylmuramoylalanine--D-glutamate ligase